MTSQGEIKQKSLHFLDERLSLVCFHFTLFTKIFHPVKQISKFIL